ncbi:MAG: RdgB/HAM1 family non-canonical purine NTP pyrophosphatase [Nitrospinae bacterium]|nr:RdgB/HAM1 family non-canonical purine NTP pyrophosphatase [Nitrospinota bacterium]
MDILVATKNWGKFDEIRKALDEIGVRVFSMRDEHIEIEEEECGRTYKENAIKKAVAAAKRSGIISLADDSGLEIDALQGMPGINSSRFAGADADDRERNSKVLEMMRGIPFGKRGARFRCVIVIATNPLCPPLEKGGVDGLYTYEGVCEGEIAESIRGDKGFGYDPIFIPTQGTGTGTYGQTFGELGTEIKNKISHRAMALEKAVEKLKSLRVVEF